jgi:hypothetical protein
MAPSGEERPKIMKLLKSSIWFSPQYTLRDMRNFISGMELSIEKMVRELAASDTWQHSTSFEVTFSIFQGENDVLTPLSLARTFFTDVVAPVNEMATIRDAGQVAVFIQSEQFLKELLSRVRPPAVRPDFGTVEHHRNRQRQFTGCEARPAAVASARSSRSHP